MQTSTAIPASKYFAELNTLEIDSVMSVDPVTEWLSSPPILSVTDPIAWWSRMDAVGHPLAPMALDFLSAPGVYYH
jgi:hypothetical protein